MSLVSIAHVCYLNARDADDAYSDALVECYGPKEGPIARYRYHHASNKVMAAKLHKHAMDDAHLAACRAANEGQWSAS